MMGKVPHFGRFCWLRLLCDFLCIAFGDDVINEVNVVTIVSLVALHFLLRSFGRAWYPVAVSS